MVQLARSRAEEFMVRERGIRLLLSEEELMCVDVCCDDDDGDNRKKAKESK
jgi:hypothetical protein